MSVAIGCPPADCISSYALSDLLEEAMVRHHNDHTSAYYATVPVAYDDDTENFEFDYNKEIKIVTRLEALVLTSIEDLTYLDIHKTFYASFWGIILVKI